MKNGAVQEGKLKAREDRKIRKWPLKGKEREIKDRTSLEGGKRVKGKKRNKPTGRQEMIRGTEMAEWKGNERGQLSFVPSWQTAEQLTLETISLCVFLRLTDFNNLPGQSCRYTTVPMPGLCPCLCCVTLNSSAFTAFSSSHNGPPPLSLAWYASITFPFRRWPLVRPCLNQPFYCYCCRLRCVLSHGIQCFLCVKRSSPTTNWVPLGSTANALIRQSVWQTYLMTSLGKIMEKIHAWCVIL